MQRCSVPVMVLWAVFTVAACHEAGAQAAIQSGDRPAIVLPMHFITPGPNELAMTEQQNGGYYRPVPQQAPYQRACGTVSTDICPQAVPVPTGATGAQVYAMAKEADATHRRGEATFLLEKSAELGYAPAQGALGMNYLRGVGLPRNTQKGLDLLERAASQGSAKAQMQLGVSFEEGTDVRADQARANAYFQAAAAQRDPVAEYRLGIDYEIGRGVAHNRATALVYLRRAAADGRSMAGTTANFLATSRVPQFHSVGEIDDAMAPRTSAAPANRKGTGSCGPPREGTFLPGIYAQYCTRYPGCPYTRNGVAYTCPPAPF